MKLIWNFEKLSQALASVRPDKIAVAYVGAQYGLEGLVSWGNVKKLIVQPSGSTNVDALKDILKNMPSDGRIFFHGSLHAKIYLGQKAALVGSANLSRNGFLGGTLEACWLVDSEEDLKQVREFFAHAESEAGSGYAQGDRGLDEQLAQMQDDAARRVLREFNVEARNALSPTFLEYCDASRKPFDVEWWWKNLATDEDKLRNADLGGHFSCGLALAGQLPKVGSWILCWQCRKDGTPCSDPQLVFMRVDKVVRGGIYQDQGKDYPHSVVELAPLKPDLQPFRIDKTFVNAFVEVMSGGSEAAKRYRPKSGEDKGWRFPRDVAHHAEWLSMVEGAYRRAVKESAKKP